MSPQQMLANKRKDLSQLDYTYDLLSGLTDEQLEAVQVVAMTFLNHMKPDRDAAETVTIPSAFQPQSEAQLLKRIDHSLAQIGAGLFESAEEVENELLMEMEK